MLFVSCLFYNCLSETALRHSSFCLSRLNLLCLHRRLPTCCTCRNPKAFLEGLLERYVSEVQRSTPGIITHVGSPSKPSTLLALSGPPAAGADPQQAEAATAIGADLPLLLSAAAVALLQAQPPLADHAVALGYVDKLVKLLAARAPPLPGGTLAPELLEGAPLLPGLHLAPLLLSSAAVPLRECDQTRNRLWMRAPCCLHLTCMHE
jgi:hypothetical protein